MAASLAASSGPAARVPESPIITMAAGGSSPTAAFLLCLLLGSISLQLDAGGTEEAAAAEKADNSMQDERWRYGNRGMETWKPFRDDDDVRKVEDGATLNENTAGTEDPCRDVKCGRHKLCVAHASQRPVCITRKKLEQRIQMVEVPGRRDPNCPSCPPAASAPVCGSDGHNYASQCKLQQQACLTGKVLSIMCAGFCPCAASITSAKAEAKLESCTGEALASLGKRLGDWFQLLHGNAKHNKSAKPAAATASALERSLLASCKDSILWMFLKLDADGDLHLRAGELAAVNLDKYEPCVGPFFNSCDSIEDGKVSVAEWCLCFWREKPPCLAELEKIQANHVAKNKPIRTYIPTCDEDGYYRKWQCEQSGGECWCVDQQGGSEVAGTRMRGNPECDEALGYSGHFGSGVGWEDEEEKEVEEEEEEEEEEETDDGGYIW
ncbi:testican-2-like [Hippocampus zosterae]|uniref:testican-2-like n=1 Tax=Hippocampus zosterae TaxID=109293 RepID=UPI00223D6ABA|nr:testican-2-like [Hippocampus zosterae]